MSLLLSIFITTIVAAPLGAIIGLKCGGLTLGPNGPRLIHRGHLSHDCAMLIGLVVGAAVNNVIVALAGAVLGAVGASYLCNYWFKRYFWSRSQR